MSKQVAWRGKNRQGRDVTLLTPAGKGAKYAKELKEKVRYNNNGQLKVTKDGEVRPLTSEQKAYRAGYLDARSDSAGAYLSDKAKTGSPFDTAKLKAHKKRKSERWKAWRANKKNK